MLYIFIKVECRSDFSCISLFTYVILAQILYIQSKLCKIIKMELLLIIYTRINTKIHDFEV